MRVFPIILITMGVVFLLVNLGVIPADWGRQWWPLILIVIGIAGLFRPESSRSRRHRAKDPAPDHDADAGRK